MSIEKVRAYCNCMKGKAITSMAMCRELELEPAYCLNLLSFMTKSKELEKTASVHGMDQYKLIKTNSAITYTDLAIDFLNEQGKGFIFNYKEMIKEIGCNKSSLKYFLLGHVKSGAIKVYRNKVPYRYEVIGELKADIKLSRKKPDIAVISVKKDMHHLFIFGGNPEVVRNNLYF